MTKTKIITLTALASLLVLSACDDKSTGEKMAESVAKLRGGTLTPNVVIDKPVKKVSSEIIKEEVQEKTEPTVEKSDQKNEKIEPVVEKEEPQISLRDIAEKAKNEIKEISQPAAKMIDSAKDATSSATASVKEVVSQTKDSAVSKLEAATAAVTSVVTPVVDQAKNEINEQVSKVKELISTEDNNSK